MSLSPDTTQDSDSCTVPLGTREPISLELQSFAFTLPPKTMNPVLVLFATALALAASSWIFEQAFPFWKILIWPLMIAIPFGLIYLGRRTIKANRRFRDLDRSRFLIDENARIRIAASAEVLNSVIDLPDEAFEPEIFERVFEFKRREWLLMLITAITLALMNQFVSRVPSLTQFTSFTMGLLVAAAMVIAFFLQRLRPFYYRIIPGRLDIVQFSAFKSGGKTIDQWDLKHAAVQIAFDKQTATLRHEDRTLIIHLIGISEPRRFVEALIRGAISKHPAPPLPDDQLLG